MTLFQALILGIVQGLTEFIPVSSSAHLIIFPWLLGWNDPSLSFDIALHLGTLAALLWVFAFDWVRLVRAGAASIIERKIGADPDRRFVWLLVLACIPGGAAGVLAESKIADLFHQPGTHISSPAMIIMAVIIVLLGLALLLADKLSRNRKGLDKLSVKDAFIIGLSQALAVFPGVSRSGSTITGGLSTGLKREDAARFSFLLAAPMVAGAGLLSSVDIYQQLKSGAMAPSELGLFAAGFAASALSGFLCIKLLLRFLRYHSTDIFVYYRWLLAALIIAVVFIRG